MNSSCYCLKHKSGNALYQQPLTNFTLFESRTRLFLVGTTSSPSSSSSSISEEFDLSPADAPHEYRVLRINRLAASSSSLDAPSNPSVTPPPIIEEDSLIYSKAEIDKMFESFGSSGPLRLVLSNVVAILGLVRLLRGYYLVLATDRKRVGSIGSHVIWSIASAAYYYVPVTDSSSAEDVTRTQHLQLSNNSRNKLSNKQKWQRRDLNRSIAQ